MTLALHLCMTFVLLHYMQLRDLCLAFLYIFANLSNSFPVKALHSSKPAIIYIYQETKDSR